MMMRRDELLAPGVCVSSLFEEGSAVYSKRKRRRLQFLKMLREKLRYEEKERRRRRWASPVLGQGVVGVAVLPGHGVVVHRLQVVLQLVRP